MSDSLKDKSVLITGGAGCLGRAISHYLLSFTPISKVVVYSRDEEKHRKMALQFKHNQRLHFRAGDVRDSLRLARAMHDIDIVIHAAAMKQVPACERDPEEATKTNIIGSINVCDAAIITARVQCAIFTSTDKAVSPCNHYGKTKAVAESQWIRANVYKPIFSATRWGNIEGSTGSVIPYFRELVEGGCGTLPITDAAMTRFLVSFDQAIAAIVSAIDAPPGLIVIPKSPSIRICDLVIAMGCQGQITGVRPGEKLDETLILESEMVRAREYERYFAIPPDPLPHTHIGYGATDVFGPEIVKGATSYCSNINRFLTVEEIQERLGDGYRRGCLENGD